MLVISGKTGSGKDTIVDKLVKEHGFKKIITYTTRPIREGEKQDSTYHFISEEDFKKKIQERFFLEYKTYHTTFGTWYYGTSFEDIENATSKSVIILTPHGYKDLERMSIQRDITCIYVYASNMTSIIRTALRGDNLKEISRRLRHDNIIFGNFEYYADHIIKNSYGSDINSVVNEIINIFERG